jgi:hypothetical protein
VAELRAHEGGEQHHSDGDHDGGDDGHGNLDPCDSLTVVGIPKSSEMRRSREPAKRRVRARP